VFLHLTLVCEEEKEEEEEQEEDAEEEEEEEEGRAIGHKLARSLLLL